MDRNKFYVGGEWVLPHSNSVIDVINPATEETIAAVAAGDVEDVDRAVVAARTAFEGWAATTRKERAHLLHELAEALAARHDEIATLITDEVGTPMRIARRIQATLPVTVLRSYAEILEAGWPDHNIGNTLVLREPVGVIGAIAPWNYPLHQMICKVAPALAAGCTVVLKPSEVAPLTAFLLAEAAHAGGIPPGVINVVNGLGPVVGEALCSHPDVDAISFTGSVPAGVRVAQVAAQTLKRVTLELGGKSANIVLDDANLDLAVKVGVSNAFLNGGQTCTAWSRLVVARAQHDRAVDLARGFAEGFAPGDPRDAATKLGPMASAHHRDTVREFVQRGIDDGAKLVTGGVEPPEGFARGFYVRPTVFADVDPGSTIAQEEIFGPVLSIIAHNGDDDAVAIANNSRFGLHGAVWSGNVDRALEVAKRVRTGTIDINGAAYNPLAPFGGYKQSGVGREMGRYGLEDYLEIKSVQI